MCAHSLTLLLFPAKGKYYAMGKYAINFDAKATLHQRDLVIIVFEGMSIEFESTLHCLSYHDRVTYSVYFIDKICLCSSYAMCYYINLNIPEVIDFSYFFEPFQQLQLSI